MNADIKLIRSRRRSLALEITPNATLIVRAPFLFPMWKIKKFVRTKQAWIRKNQDRILKKQLRFKPKQYISGEEFLYLGETCQLKIIDNQAESLVLEGDFRLSSQYLDRADEIFTTWYKEEAENTIKERLEYFSSTSSLKYKAFRISNAKKRWGSCSIKGSLNFSWRLIMAPVDVIDYVIVHELVHLAEHNHSRKFWQKVANIMPDYRKHRKWLRENGNYLYIE